MSKKYWLASEFEIEFAKVRKLKLPEIFKYQIERVAKIVDHWQKCKSCTLGFNISEYSGTFEEIFLKLAHAPIEIFVCNGDYEVMWTKSY